MNEENQNIEYKTSWHDEYLKWVCGFANAQGGKLYIGIDDNGNVCGVENVHKLSEEIPNKIVALLGIVADVNVLQKNGKDYIEIDVAPSNVPISLKGIYHYRSGSTKQELNGIALQQFILKKLGRTWDDIICEKATLEHIDRSAIDYFLMKAVDAQRLPKASLNETTENVLQNLGLLDFDGKLKNAAILLFGKTPQRFFTGVEFKIGFFGKNESDLLFQDLIEGNILKMCDTVIETLKAKYLISPIHYEGLQRIEPLEIPEDALREAIFNSIIHKDYNGPSIQMKVYRDRIELWNYGKLPEEITIEKLLGKHSSNARNKNIAASFYKAGFIEAWGRGISKIVTEFTEAGLKKPEFEDFCGGVLVTIYRDTNLVANLLNPQTDEETTIKTTENAETRENSETTQKTTQKIEKTTQKTTQKIEETREKTREKIIQTMREIPNITMSELALKCEITFDGIKWQIKQLKDKGVIRRVGSDRDGHWEIIDDIKK